MDSWGGLSSEPLSDRVMGGRPISEGLWSPPSTPPPTKSDNLLVVFFGWRGLLVIYGVCCWAREKGSPRRNLLIAVAVFFRACACFMSGIHQTGPWRSASALPSRSNREGPRFKGFFCGSVWLGFLEGYWRSVKKSHAID